jgi:hypothetical protein
MGVCRGTHVVCYSDGNGGGSTNRGGSLGSGNSCGKEEGAAAVAVATGFGQLLFGYTKCRYMHMHVELFE